MNNKFVLTKLEKSALLKKAGITKTLLEGRDIHLQEMDGLYDPSISPDGEWDHESWYGGPNSGGAEGYYGLNRVFRVELSAKKFVILTKLVRYHNGSSFTTNEERDYPDGDNPNCGTFFYVFRSDGAELDSARLSAAKLQSLLESAEKHLPEAIKMLREEYSSLNSK